MGALTVWLAYKLGRLLVPDKPVVGLLGAALLAFNPQFIFITASVNNDVLTALLGAAIVVVSIQLVVANWPLAVDHWRNAFSMPFYRTVLLLGILLGLGALTKLALFALWPVAGLAVLVVIWRGREQGAGGRSWFGRMVASLSLLVLPAVLLAGWWYLRGQLLYGDPLAWDVHLAAKGTSVLRLEPFGWADLVEFGRFHFQSYWALFGWLNIAWPGWVYWLVGLMVVSGLVGLVWFVVKLIRMPRNWDAIVAVGLTMLAVVGIYASLLRYIQTINWSGYQGRLAFAVAAPIALLLALGLATLFGRIGSLLIGSGMALLALLTLLFVISPAFLRPMIYQPAAQLPRTCIHFEGGYTIEAYAAPDVIRPNETVKIALHAYGYTDGMGMPLVIDLLAADGTVLAEQRVATGPWATDQLSQIEVELTVPDAAPIGQAYWRAGGLNRSGEFLPAVDVYGRDLSIPPTLSPVLITDAPID
jgi:hypothetical protein